MKTGERRLDVFEFLVVAQTINCEPLQLLAEVIEAMPDDSQI